MNRKFVSALLFLSFIFGLIAPAIPPSPGEFRMPIIEPSADGSAIPQRASELLGGMFTENMGQVENEEILFYAASGTVAFTRDSVLIYTPIQSPPLPKMAVDSPAGRSLPEPGRGNNIVRFSFPGSNSVIPSGCDAAASKSNYLKGSDPGGWHTGVNNYYSILYENLWDGIDLIYRIEGRALKYDIMVHPHADHSQIALKVGGQAVLALSGAGVDIRLGDGTAFADSGLDVFYAGSENQKLDASFIMLGNDTYSFSLRGRDPDRTVVIDPLIYSTYLGGSGQDCAMDIAVGTDGCAYVTGYTESPNFPLTFGAYDQYFDNYSYDLFVAKMGLNGDTFVYSTYLGGMAGDFGQAISVDSAGHAYVTGYTMSSDFPTTEGAFDRTYNGDTYDAFVSKLGPMGNSLVYSTYLGGAKVDCGNAIAVDSGGFAYVAGETHPTTMPTGDITFSFPTSEGSFRWFGGLADIFVAKVSQTGSFLVYSTAFGTDDYDYANSIAVDASGYAYITGQTRSSAFPVSTTALDRSFNGGYDAFVLKLTQSGTSMSFSTYLGGVGSEFSTELAIGIWGHIYITGYTSSEDFPTTSAAYDGTFNGDFDVFVSMMSKHGDMLVYSTYVGGANGDYGTGIALDSSGSACVAGYTSSPDFPATPHAFDGTYNGGVDGFMSKLSVSGNIMQQSTFLGGAGQDCCRGIAITQTGFAYLAGDTASSDFPTASGSMDMSPNGKSDAFVTKLDIAPPSPDAGQDQKIMEGQTVAFDASGSTDNHGISNYTWSFGCASANITLFGPRPSYLFSVPGIYNVLLNVSDASHNWATATTSITVVDITRPIARAGPDQTENEDTPVFFNGSASTDNVGIVNYTWSFKSGAGLVRLFGTHPVYTFASPGTYTVTLVVLDAAGNEGTDTLQAEITDITGPDADAGPDIRIYNGSIFTFDGSASTDNVLVTNYTWRFSDGVAERIAYGQTISHLFALPGVYPVTLEVADAVGLHDTDGMVLTVLETVRPTVVAGADIQVSESEPAVFDGSACTDNVGVAKWVWSFNDGLNDVTLFGEHPTWIFMTPGVFPVMLNASDAAGNWDTDSLDVEVLDKLPPMPIPGRNIAVETGTNVTFDGSASYDSSGITGHAWTFIYNGTPVTLEGPVRHFEFWTAGTYAVTLTVWDAAGKQASSNITVTVYDSQPQSETVIREPFGWALVLVSAVLFLGAAFIIHRRKKGAPGP